MLCGLPLSGKTTYSLKLQKDTGYKRFSLDEEYFKVVGNTQQKERDFELEEKIEAELKERIAPLIKNGESIILDYCPWKKDKRAEYREFIDECGGEMKLIYFDVPLSELKRRAEGRNSLKDTNHQFITSQMLEDFVERFDVPNGEGEKIVK